MTNQSGKFVLKAQNYSSHDTVEISYLGFRSFRLGISDIRDGQSLSIQLQAAPEALQEVVVRLLNPAELIDSAKKRIAHNYFTVPHVTRGFYRIDTKKGNEHIMLSEAVFDILNPGYTSTKPNNFQLVKMRSIQDEKASHGIDLGLKPKGIYAYDVVKQIGSSGVFSKEGMKKHKFVFRGVTRYNGIEVYKILFDQDENLKESLYKGQLLLDVQTLAFVSIQTHRSPRGIAYAKYGDAATRTLLRILGLNIDIKREALDIVYRPYGEKWVLSSVREETRFNFKSGRQFYNFPADIRVDYIVTDTDTSGTDFADGSALGNNKFIEHQASDTASDFWKDYNILLPDYSTDQIVKEIRQRNESFNLKDKAASKARKARGDNAARIDSIISFYHSNGAFNGSVLIKHKGNVLLSKGYGYADKDLNLAASDTTQFRIGSLTKSFTGQIILQLVNSGKLRLTDTVGKFLHGHVHGAVTIEQLLTHTSGVPSYTKKEEHLSTIMRKPYSTKELAIAVCSDEAEFEKGTQFSYSNSGYILLAAIIEEVTGRSYGEVLKEKVLDPLNMQRSGFAPEQMNSTGYWLGQKEPSYPVRNTVGAGGIASTTADLLKWDEAMYEGKLLPDSSLQASFTPRAPYVDWDADYGYGWMIDKKMFWQSRRHTIIYHPGTDFGYYAMFVRVPGTRTLVVLLSNTGDFPRFDMTDLILQELK